MKRIILVFGLVLTGLALFGQSPRIRLNQITKDSLTGSVVLSGSDSNMVYSRDFFLNLTDSVLILFGDTLSTTATAFTGVATDLTLTGNGKVGTPLKVDTAIIATVSALTDSLAGIISSVTTDLTLTGDGSVATPLKVDTAVIATIKALADSVATRGTVSSVAVSAGTGISVSGSPITTSGTITVTNLAPDQTVSITGAGINAVTGTYPNFTITGTEVDGSTTNELQTISTSGAAGNITLSNGGGTLNLNVNDADASATNEGSLSVGAGGANSSDIVSNTSGSTNVTIAGGSNVTVTESGSTITIASTAGGTGTVTDITAGTFLGGGTITASGTIALDTASAGLKTYISDNKGTVDLASGVTGTLPVANGGTGATTLSGAGIVTGTGTNNYLPKFTGSTTVGNSQIFDNGTNIGINTSTQLSPSGFGYSRWIGINAGSSGDNSMAIDLQGSRTVAGAFVDINFWHQSTSNRAYIQARRGSTDSQILFSFVTSGGSGMTLDASGNLGLGVTPTAVLHPKAGTASANTAPLKFTSGTKLTTPEVGAMEFEVDSLLFTTTNLGRKQLAYTDNSNVDVLSVSKGGTGATTLTSGSFLKGNGTSAISGSSNLTETTDTVFVSKFLNVDTSTLYVDAINNRVGIGTTTPFSQLTVTGQSYLTRPASRIGNSTIQPFGADNIIFGTNVYFDIDSFAIIVIDSAWGSWYQGFQGSSLWRGTASATNAGQKATIVEQIYFSNNGTYVLPSKDVTEYTSDYFHVKDSAIIVKSDGKVGIGMTLPGSRLHTKSATSNDALLVEDDSGACEAQPTTTGLTWSCSSDQRLKTDIQIPAAVLDYVKNIPLKDYTVIKTAERVMGPIAQELLQTYPELVSIGEDGYYRVSSLGSWTLVKAIQEQQAIIESQKTEIDQLKTQYNDLLQRIINLENK